MQYIWSIFPCTEGLRIFPIIILHSCPFCVVQAGSHVWVEQRLPRFLQEVVASPCAWSAQRLPAAAHLLGCSQTFIPTHHTRELCFCRVFFIAKYVKGFFCKFRVCFGVGFFLCVFYSFRSGVLLHFCFSLNRSSGILFFIQYWNNSATHTQNKFRKCKATVQH